MSPEMEILHGQQCDRQLMLARLLQGRNLSLKAIAGLAGIPYANVRSYFPGERDPVVTAMPMHAFYALIGVIPDDLLSTLIDPKGVALIRIGNCDNDEIASAAAEYLGEHVAARRADSEAGSDIGPHERDRLDLSAARLRAAT